MRFLLLTFAFLIGCAPDVPDGHFACDDGMCPAEYDCRADRLCYGPSAPPSALYSLCFDDADCDSGTCANAPSMVRAETGICTKSCATNNDCPMVSGRTGICTAGSCFATCAGAADCADPSKCVLAPGLDPTMICVLVDDEVLEGRAACSSDSECRPPTRCRKANATDSKGLCAWPCGPPSAECPGDSECHAIPGSATADRICTGRCATMSECSGGANCIATQMPGPRFCGAPNWLSYP